MTRYTPSRTFLWAGMSALVLGGFCGGYAVFSLLALVPAVLFLVSAALLLWLALRPPVGIGADFLLLGNRRIPWAEISRVDRTSWMSPLVVRLQVLDSGRVFLIYAGDFESSGRLLRHLRRSARYALIDGAAYSQFWGEPSTVGETSAPLSSPRYRLLRKEDEEEVERMYRRLRSVGRIDSQDASSETQD